MIPTATLFPATRMKTKIRSGRHLYSSGSTSTNVSSQFGVLESLYTLSLRRQRSVRPYQFSLYFQEANSDSYALSIGGDNYCYGVPVFIYLVNKQLRKQGIKTILWGCSVEPEVLKGDILNDLRSYTHIFARESITYEAMKEKGIQQLSLFPDPAFQLNRTDLTLPEVLQKVIR